MLKKLRLNHPIWFCVLMLVLAQLGSVLAAFAAFVPDLKSATLIENCLGQMGSVLILLLVLMRTDRLSVLSARGEGLGRGIVRYGIPIIAFAVISIFIGPLPERQLNPPLTIAIFLIWMLFIGMSEEFECRAVMSETLLEHFGTDRSGMIKAVVVSGLVFGLMHMTNFFVGATLTSVIAQSAQAFVIGVVFALIYFRTGNIWVSVTIHAIWDFFSLLGIKNALFSDSTATLTSSISGTEIWSEVIICAIFLAYAFILLRSKGMDELPQKWFGGYCQKMEQERAELAAKKG